MNTKVAQRKYELLTHASKLSLRELNDLIDKCLDEKNYDDAKIFADIWNNRRSSK